MRPSTVSHTHNIIQTPYSLLRADGLPTTMFWKFGTMRFDFLCLVLWTIPFFINMCASAIIIVVFVLLSDVIINNIICAFYFLHILLYDALVVRLQHKYVYAYITGDCIERPTQLADRPRQQADNMRTLYTRCINNGLAPHVFFSMAEFHTGSLRCTRYYI